MKFLDGWAWRPRNNRLYFCGYLADHDPEFLMYSLFTGAIPIQE